LGWQPRRRDTALLELKSVPLSDSRRLGVSLVLGPNILIAAVTVPKASKIGAAMQQIQSF
jgi:hypothetical protein